MEAVSTATAGAEASAGASVDAVAAVVDRARRFGGFARLYGAAAAQRLAGAHAVVVGIGGVGSWAVEALARSGIGRLTLIDLDHVAESNINRQLHALESTLGASKVGLMAERVRDICPQTVVDAIEDFVSADNASSLLPAGADVVVDAIDSPRAKAALIAACAQRGQGLVVCGAAGGRTDPLALRRADLADVRGDALLAAVRNRLRRDHGYPAEAGRRFGVTAIHSPAPPRSVGGVAPASGGAALACSGYGSIVTVTASMGMAAAGAAIEALLSRGGSR